MSKYNAIPTVRDGIKFASASEARRYRELKLLQSAGAISDLKLQVKYPCVVNGVKVCDYVSDFDYTEDGKRITEDVKGFKTPVYRLKKKLVKAIYGITISEYKP